MKGPLNVIDGMTCDGGSRVLIGCLHKVVYGLRIHVPSKTQDQPGHAQIRVTLTLHCCEEHKGTFKLDDLLVAKIRSDVETHAKRSRPIDWKPDFEAAFLQYVDIFSPEYRKFVQAMEVHTAHEVRQLWGPVAGHG